MSSMARGKAKIAPITDERMLKSTFQKRKEGLMKKAMELTTLCDIVACVIIYGPAIGGRAPEIFTWPEDQEKVRAAIRMYKEKMDHSRRSTDLCNYLKDRRRLKEPDNLAGYATGDYAERRQGDLNIPVELAVAYLNWVDARIKAVAERIEFVKSSLMNQNMMFDDHMMLMPAVPNQDPNFGHGFMQECIYSQNPCEDFTDLDVYDQTLYRYNPPCTNSVPPVMVQFQSTEPNQINYRQQNQILIENFDHSENQNQNQMILHDPYWLEKDCNIMTASSFSGGQYYQQHGENMPFLSNAAPRNLVPSNMDERMQLCPYPEEWSGSDISSSNYSISSTNQLTKPAIDVPSFDDHLDFYLQTLGVAAESEFQPPGEIKELEEH